MHDSLSQEMSIISPSKWQGEKFLFLGTLLLLQLFLRLDPKIHITYMAFMWKWKKCLYCKNVVLVYFITRWLLDSNTSMRKGKLYVIAAVDMMCYWHTINCGFSAVQELSPTELMWSTQLIPVSCNRGMDTVAEFIMASPVTARNCQAVSYRNALSESWAFMFQLPFLKNYSPGYISALLILNGSSNFSKSLFKNVV